MGHIGITIIHYYSFMYISGEYWVVDLHDVLEKQHIVICQDV